jgi:hypothetical protein
MKVGRKSLPKQFWMNVTNVLCCDIRSFPGITDYFILFYCGGKFAILLNKKKVPSDMVKGTLRKISRKQ